MLKIIPRKQYILVKPDDVESTVNDAGLSAPENSESEERATGVVVSFDPKIEDMEKGARVVYGVLAGEVVKRKENGKEVEYKLLHDDDVIAFLK